MADVERKDVELSMRKALLLAANGRGRVEPNPLVGAVVMLDDKVVGHGYHARYGGPHAEVAALDEAGAAAEGSTLFVTLEPCGHEGKTPPCAKRIIEAGVRRVVYATADPNPVTAGVGPRLLEEAGIEVHGGVLRSEANALNRRYEEHLGSDLPFTIAKWAMTLDGRIADAKGASKYITGEESLRLVHEIRGSVDAIVVGVGTVVADDPELTVRGAERTRDPVRVVIDTRLCIPGEARVVATAGRPETWILTAQGVDPARRKELEAAGCRILPVPASPRGVDLLEAFRALRSLGVARVLLEGGSEIHASAFAAGVVRQVMAFVAPKLVGGRRAPAPIGGEGLRRIGDALDVEDLAVRRLGPDVLLEGFIASRRPSP